MKIGYGKQSINKKDVNEVIKSIKGKFITQGPKVHEFEKSLSKYFGSKYCCVVNNGTSALFLAGIAMKWKKNDVVLTTPLAFVASANSIIYNNATPDFVDINKKNLTIDLNLVEEKIKFYKKNGRKIKALIGVDFAGHPCDWPNLRYLANKHQFQLINDNCHALGAEIDNNHKYAIKYADIVTQSFHPVKNITTGEGGAVITNSKEYINKLYESRTHGIIKDNKPSNMINEPWSYDIENLGYNFRLTDFQCALGINQLKRIKGFINKRNIIAKFYDKNLNFNENIKIPFIEKNIKHAYHLYAAQFDFNKTKITKKQFYNKLNSKGINLMVHYVPIISFSYYKKNFKFKIKNYPNSINYYEKAFSLPIFTDLKKNQLEFICSIIMKYFK
tara:strand:- start:61 stop:1224 length:1164 start_codon:yes stop_codon:yes gene_type:complete